MATTAERLQVLVEAEVDKAIRDLKKLDTTTGGTTKKFNDFGKLLKGGAIAGGLAAITVAGAKLIQVGGDLIDSYAKQEQADAKLQQTLTATGYAAGLTFGQLQQMAKGLQSTTKFGDDAIQSAESLLLTFKSIGEDVFPTALSTVLDMSEALGQDLKSSSIQLGKALNDPITGVSALQRVGVSFTQSQKDTIASMVEMNNIAGAQNIILNELQSEFGGVAVAAAQTATGGFTQLKNVAGDTKEILGGLLTDALGPLADGFKDALLGINQYIVAQRALNAVEQGSADIEQAKIARTEQVNELKRLQANLANTELRLAQQQTRQNGISEAQQNSIRAQLAATVDQQRENIDAIVDQISATDALIKKKQDEIDTAQQNAAATVAADSQAAASTLAKIETINTAEADLEAQRKIRDENQRTLLQNALDFRKSIIDRGTAYAIAKYQKETDALKEEMKKREDAYNTAAGILVDSIEAAAEASDSAATAIQSFYKTAALGIALVLDGLAKELAARAVAAGIVGDLKGAAKAGAAAIAAAVGAGVIRNAAQKFQTGTGPSGYQIPPGYPNDTYPVMASSGETVKVERSGSGGGGQQPIYLVMDGRILGQVIGDLSDAGQVRINKAVVR